MARMLHDHEKPADCDQLMVRVQQGEREAFEELVEKFEGPLQRFFLANTNDSHLAEDLAQETLIRVYNKAWNYLPCGRFPSWLFCIARNLLVDSIRRFTRDALVHSKRVFDGECETLVVETVSSGRGGPDQQAASSETMAVIRELILEISEEQRLVLTLTQQTDMTHQQIAVALEIPVGTCKSRLRLARNRLARLLEQHGLLSTRHPVVRRWARPTTSPPRVPRHGGQLAPSPSRSAVPHSRKPVTM